MGGRTHTLWFRLSVPLWIRVVDVCWPVCGVQLPLGKRDSRVSGIVVECAVLCVPRG